MRLLLFSILLLSMFISQGQTPRVIKAAWVTNVGSNVLKNLANIRQAVQVAKASGLNTPVAQVSCR
jgi:uncharacterized lipoprotein YddW (UPF0748 family)